MFRTRSPRLYSNELNRFKLELNLNIAGHEFFAVLGDISASGLCAIVPVEEDGILHTDLGADIEGILLGPNLAEELHFEASVVWQEMGSVNGKNSYLVGLEFNGAVQLPPIVVEALNQIQA